MRRFWGNFDEGAISDELPITRPGFPEDCGLPTKMQIVASILPSTVCSGAEAPLSSPRSSTLRRAGHFCARHLRIGMNSNVLQTGSLITDKGDQVIEK